MDFIKNIILYDTWQNVSGFVELKNTGGRTQVKLRHSLSEKELVLSLVEEGGQSYMFQANGTNGIFEIKGAFDLSRELVACLCAREGNKVTTLASGIVNPRRKDAGLKPDTKFQNVQPSDESIAAVIEETAFVPIRREEGSTAARVAVEIDELLRKVCTVDDAGRGQCETCPYRDYFYEFTLNRGNNATAPAALLGTNEA